MGSESPKTANFGHTTVSESNTFVSKVQSWISWSWRYLCGIWFLLIMLLVWVLRGPLKLKDNLNLIGTAMTTLTPKFYIALTGSSSFISGIILLFEWWYFRKNGTSFIEQMSMTYIGPILGLPIDQQTLKKLIAECKVWRNPMSLLRGAEYQRLKWTLNQDALTPYDISLSEKDHLSFFTCSMDQSNGRPGDSKMLKVWKEKNLDERVQLAHEALVESNSNCPTAFILLGEEEATSIEEAESLFKQALKASESCLKQYNSLSADEEAEACHRRDVNVCVYIKRRLAMFSRKLGRTKESVKMIKDLLKEFPLQSVLNIHENLIEALLELQAYSEVLQVLTKYDDISLPKSATICYTAALLKVRTVAEKFSPDLAAKKGLTPAEMSAVEAIHRAVEFNPHVPKYLLEEKAIILPPEHILKRGDSEAIAYGFFHLRHWKRVEGALNLLNCTWEGTFRLLPYPLEKGHLFHPYPSCTEAADKELLPKFHQVSVYPHKELPFFILFNAALCSLSAILALLTCQFPVEMGYAANTALTWLAFPVSFIFQKFEDLFPAHILQHISSL